MNQTVPLLRVTALKMEFVSSSSLLARLVRRRSETLVAIDGVDLDVFSGEALGIVGESGSGKSTLARCIAGLYEPTSGTLNYAGKVLPRRRPGSLRRRIQIVFQDPYASLNPRMTVEQTVKEILAVHNVVPRLRREARFRELMDLVRLGPELASAYPRQLSGGQRQRVSIARALALEPELLIADEPVSALDVSVQASILNLLADLRQQLRLTLVFIAHDLSVVHHLCDRVAVMYLGRVVEVAEVRALFDDPRHPYTQGLLRSIPSLVPSGQSSQVGVVGDPPSPYAIPSGCRFRSRCPIAQPVCTQEDPALQVVDGHAAACHFAWKARSALTGRG
jgi:oligopeptide/dipeptide ABC transporter ATP-binding protein